MIGRTLSHYRVDAQIGAGGMGVVYRARDLHLERDVALKVLPEDLLADDAARSRFRREALALSRLPHAHITTVHDYDVQDGVQFLVMELVPGRTLAETLTHAPLPEHEVVRLGLQIAGALQIAHEAGVLHRDLKPANVMVTPRGEAKVMDFGLARRFGAASELSATVTATAPGMLTGTLAYLAPELLMGQEASAQSDLYALGVTLYEMATGRRPHGESQAFALANAIMNQEAPAPRKVRPELSAALEAIVLKCLARDPAARYASAQELIADLTAPAEAEAAQAAARREAGRRRTQLAYRLVTAALTLAAALVVATALDLGGLRSRLFGARPIRSIAVLPLANLSNDPEQEYFADGMTEELTTSLAQVGALTVISRASAMTYKGTKKSLNQIGREMHVDLLVTGSVRRVGKRVRISAQLIRASSNQNLWAEAFERDLDDVFAIQSQISTTVARRVQARITDQEKARLARAQTVDPEALEAYLQGLHQLRMTGVVSADAATRAVELFEHSLKLDPRHAQAWTGLARAYYALSSMYVSPADIAPKARAAAQRALEIDPDLAEAHAVMGIVAAQLEWDWDTAGREFQEAMRLNPSSADAHGGLAAHLLRLGQLDRAQVEWDRACELDPLSIGLANVSNWNRYLRGRSDEAIARLNDLQRTAPTDAQTWYNLGQCYLSKGQGDRAVSAFLKAEELANAIWPLGLLGHAYAATGRRAEALAVLDRLRVAADTVHVSPYFFAQIHAGLADHDQCFVWLEKCYSGRDENLTALRVDPVMRPLRTDPRFTDLLRRLKLAG